MTASERDAAETPRERSLLLTWWFPVLGITAVALAHALYLRAIAPNPYQLDIFFHLFRVHELPAALVAIGLFVVGGLAALAAAQRGDPTAALLRWLAANPRLVALVLFGLLVAGTQVVYRDFPLSMDEYAMVFQAQAFAAGELTGQLPPATAQMFVPPFFIDYFFTAGLDGRIVSDYWPGFSLLLAPFAAVGAAWLLNPLLAAGSFWLIVRLARRLLGDTAAGWAALFCLASPELWIDGLSYYAMTAHLFFNLLFATLLLDGRAARLVLAGVAGSIALVLHQPLPHLLFAAPWGVWLLLSPGRWRKLGLVGLGYLPLSLLLGLGWPALRAEVRAGEAPPELAAVIEQRAGEGAVLALPRERPAVANPFTLPDRRLLWTRLFNLLKLWLWAAPGLVWLAVLGLFPARAGPRASPRLPRGVGLFAWSLALTFLGHLFVPYSQGHGWGFRYLHGAWSALPLLAAAAMTRRFADWAALRRIVLWTCLLAIPMQLGLRSFQVRTFIDSQRTQVPALDAIPEGERWLVFLDPTNGYYRADLLRNDPFLRGPVWMLVTHGAAADADLARRLDPDATLVRESGGESIWKVPLP